MELQKIPTSSPFGKIYGYSRAVRKGPFVYVSGTMAANEKGEKQGENSYEESVYILEIIKRALNEVGAALNDVVRTRVYITDISTVELVAKAHSEFFGTVQPAATLIQITSLISPGFTVEIEADAIVSDE